MPSFLRSRLLLLLPLLLGACAGSPPARDAAGAPPLQIVTREERIAVDATTRRFVLRNPHGDVRLRITDQAMVGVHATIQRIGAVPLDPDFDIHQRDGVFELTIRYPDEERLRARGDHGYGRVDLGVWVPANLELDLATDDGLLQVKRAQSPLRARTGGGALQVTAAADIDLATTSGDIAFSQYSGEWDAPARIHSDSGHIYASIPAFADIKLSVRAGGRIEAPPEMPRPGVDGDGMRLQAEFGSAARSIGIVSGAGDVYLYTVVPDSALVPSGDDATNR